VPPRSAWTQGCQAPGCCRPSARCSSSRRTASPST
jgi:hypothetical protein